MVWHCYCSIQKHVVHYFTGHLRPDDIPTALGDATCLYELFLDRFSLDVTTNKRVYRDHPLQKIDNKSIPLSNQSSSSVTKSKNIYATTHYFDAKPRKQCRKRKSTDISSYDQPAHNAVALRPGQYRCDHSSILPHKRAKFEDSDVL